MDFLKIIRSIEELLFECMAWLVYYPRTMWMVVRHPLRMMNVADHELRVGEGERYADTLSPPLLLLLTILLTHGLALAAANAVTFDEAAATTKVFGSHQNLVLVRSLCFAVLPLTAAYAFVRRAGRTLERKDLRPPFFGHCYLTAPYALAVSLGVLGMEAQGRAVFLAGAVLAAAATLLYLGTQAAQFRRCLAMSVAGAIGLSLLVFVGALLIVFGVAAVAVGFNAS